MKKILSILSVILFTGSLWTANAAPAAGTFWKETFSKMGTNTKYNTSQTNVTGDKNVYAWSMRNFRRNGETVGDETGVRIAYKDKNTNNYIEFKGNQEGGIKGLYFKWKNTGSVNYYIEITGDGLSKITRTITATTGNPSEFEEAFNVSQNAKLKLSVNSSGDAIVFGPISIVPYLLFTNKSPEVNISPSVTSFDLKTIWINNTTGDAPTYEVSNNTTGGQATITDGVVDLSDVTASGSMKITAKWSKVTTTTTLTVTLPTPTITLENAEVALNGSYKPQPVVTVGETVMQDPTITYTSSNASVATVEGSTFTLLGTGTSTITATVAAKAGAYKQAQKAVTLTVTAVAPEAGTFWKETFSKQAIGSSYVTTDTKLVGDSSVYAWNLYDFRRNGEQVDGETGVRLGTSSSNRIEFDGIQEGGIKDLYFKWLQAGSNPVTYTIEVTGDGLNTITRTITGSSSVCAQKLNVAQNAKLKLHVSGSNAVVFGPISVVPYLLFTNKTPKADVSVATSFDLNEILIDNTDATPTFTVTENTTDGAATITDGVIDLSDVTTSGSMKITATWGSVTTTTTLTVAAIPTPTIELENAEVAINGSYQPQPVVKIGETVVQDPVITYTSSNASVATVDASGNFTLLGTGTSKITVNVAAKDKAYTEAQKEITLTVTAVAPAANTFWKESFSKLAIGSSYVTTDTKVAGDSSVYAWNLYDFRRNGEQVDGETGVRLGTSSSNRIEFDGIQEGGIKDLYFKWLQAGSNPVTYTIEVTGDGLNTITRTITGSSSVCAQKLNVAQNAKLKLHVSGSNAVVFGPISVVPYLLFTNKAPKVDISPSVTSFDLKTILLNNTDATPTYEVSGNTTGSAATITNGVIALNDVKASGSMKITATWGNVTTTTTLAVTLPTPTIELENAEVALNGSYVPQPVVKIGETVVENPTITYTSSNASVATVDGSTFTLLGTGTSTITVTVAAKDYAYNQVKKDITLTVTAVAPEAGKFWKETFSKMATKNDYEAERTEVAGDSSVYAWYARYYTHKSGTDDNVGDERGVRLKYDNTETKKSNYIEFNGNQEGGIKDLYFKWRLPGSGNQPAKYQIEITGEGLSQITRTINTTVSAGIYGLYECAQKLNVAQNAKLKIHVLNGSEPVIFGPVSIVPYLLFTNKAPEVVSSVVSSFDLKTILLNNTDATPTFTVTENTTGSAATITDGVIDLSDVTTAGIMKVKATWGNVSTTTTLTVAALPTPTIELEDAEVALNGSYVPQPVVKIGEEVVSDPVITYQSSNSSVATVDESGNFTLLGTGTSTITVTVAAKEQEYKQAQKEITLTVTAVAPEAGKFWKETFSKMATKNDYVEDRIKVAGDSSVYAWYARYYTHKSGTDDNVGDERGVRLKYNEDYSNYIEFDGNQEGGIKDLYFKWRLPGSGNQPAKYRIEITGDGLSKITRTINTNVSAGIYGLYECAQKLNVAQNAKLKIHVLNGSEPVIFGPVSIVPYLLYTKKAATVTVGETYKNEALIDNRDNETAITYSCSNDNATVEEDGTVTANHVGTVTITATWGSVTTTYQLTIQGGSTKIALKRNDGTEDADTIVNNYGEVMPVISQPAREGYRFNAYWATSDFVDKTRFTRTIVVNSTDSTDWVASRKVGNVTCIDADRKWVYEGKDFTLYAQWMPELTITLDNQDATTPGTDKVITARCENNNSVNLSEDITVPAKDNVSFMGYFTETAGQGTQLIDKDGAFIADVEGYTNASKMWLKEEGATLYAYWKREQKEVSDTTAASDIPQWADVTVNEGGNLVMDDNKTFSSLVIKATASATGTSGQITGATDANLEIKGDAYFDLTLAKNGTADQWHAFTVPFQVDMINGIYDLDGTKLTNEVNYAIMVYQGDVRAQGKYGWIKVHKTGNTILQPGTFYIMATDGERATYRMKMYGAFSVASENLTVHEYAKSGEGEDTDAGWNGIGNSQLDYRMVDGNVQVLDPESYSFMTFTAKDTTFAVGTPFFYQAAADGTVVLEKEDAQAAPMRAVNKELKNIAVTMANEDYTDRLYISATSEATDAYQIGKDMSKMSMTSTPAVPQICAQAYGTKLSMIDLPMDNEEVTYDLSLYAPKAGEYTITAASVENATIYLYEDGSLVWNLSMGACTVDMAKGNNGAYSLVMKLNKTDVITGADAVNAQKDGIQKFIYNDQLIIIRDGKTYNGTGALMK